MVKLQVIVGPFPTFEIQVRIINTNDELKTKGKQAVERSEKVLGVIVDRINQRYPSLNLKLEDVIEYHVDKDQLEDVQVVDEFNLENI